MNQDGVIFLENSHSFPEDAANILPVVEASDVCPFLLLTLLGDTTCPPTPLTVALREHPLKFSKSNPDELESCDDGSKFNYDTRTSNPANWDHSSLLLSSRPEQVNGKIIPKSKLSMGLFSKKSIRNVNPLNRNRGIVQFKLKSGEYRSDLSKQEHRKRSIGVPKSNQSQRALVYNPDKPISQGVPLVLNFRDSEFKSNMVNLSSVFGKPKQEKRKASENKKMNFTTCNIDELASYADVLKLDNGVVELQSECKNIAQSSDDNNDHNDESQSAMTREIDSEGCADKPSSYAGRLKFNINASESVPDRENIHLSDAENQNCEAQSTSREIDLEDCPGKSSSYDGRLKLNIIATEIPTECTRNKEDGNYDTHSAVSRDKSSACCPDKPSKKAEKGNLNVCTSELPRGLCRSRIPDKEIRQGLSSGLHFRETELKSTLIAISSVFGKTNKTTTKKKMKKQKTSANYIINATTRSPDELALYADDLKLNDVNELQSESENIPQSSVDNNDQNGVIHSRGHRERDSEFCPDNPSIYAGRLKLKACESTAEVENIHLSDERDRNCETHREMSRERDSECRPDKQPSCAEQVNLNNSACESAPELRKVCDPDKEIIQRVSSGQNSRDMNVILFNLSSVFGKTKTKKKKNKQKKLKTIVNEVTNVTCNSDELTSYDDVLKLNNVTELQLKKGNIPQSSKCSRENIHHNCETQSTVSREIDSESCPDKPSSYAGRLKLNISFTVPPQCENVPHSSSDNNNQNSETHSAMSTRLDLKCRPDKPTSYAGRLKLNIVHEIAPLCENISLNAPGNKDQNCENSAVFAEIGSEYIPDKRTRYANQLKLNVKESEFAVECENIHTFSSEMNGWSHKCSAGKINEREILETGHNSESVSRESQLTQTPKTQDCISSCTNADNIVSFSETESSEQLCVTEPEELHQCLNEQDKHDCHADDTYYTDPEQLSAITSDYSEFDDILRDINQAITPESPWRELQMPTEHTHTQNRMTALLEQPPFINWSPIVNTSIRKDVKNERKDKDSLQDGHLPLGLDDDDDDGYPSSPNYMTLLSDADSEVLTPEPSNYSADSYFRGLLDFPIPESQRPESWMQSYLRRVRGDDMSMGTQEGAQANPWWAFSQNSLESCQNQSGLSESNDELKRQVTDLSARIQSAEEQLDTWKEVSAKLIAQHEQLQSKYEQEVRELTEKLEKETANAKRLQKDLCELAKNKKEAHMDPKTEPGACVNQLSRPNNMYSHNETPKFYKPGSNNTPNISAQGPASYPPIVPPGVSPLQLTTPPAAVCNYPRMGISTSLGPQLRPPAAAVLFSQLQTVYSAVSSVYRFSGIRNPYVLGPQHKRPI